jgi:hypothetical protein
MWVRDLVIQILAGLALAAFSAAAGVLTVRLRRYLSTKGLAEEFGWVVAVVDEVVQGIEQLGAKNDWTGEEKLDKAITEAAKRTGLSRDLLKELVEAAVLRLKTSMSELVQDDGGKVVRKDA